MLSGDPGGADGLGTHRYLLWRTWGPGRRWLLWVMLNPSTATGLVDDPTIRRITAWSKLWGFDGFLVVNLYAHRSSKPAHLRTARYPVGPENDRAIQAALRHQAQIVVAWGDCRYPARIDDVRRLIVRSGYRLWCLGTTKNGNPKHPLARGRERIPDDQELHRWR